MSHHLFEHFSRCYRSVDLDPRSPLDSTIQCSIVIASLSRLDTMSLIRVAPLTTKRWLYEVRKRNHYARTLSSFDVNSIVVRDRVCPLPKIKQRLTSIVANGVGTNERCIPFEQGAVDTSEQLGVVNTGTSRLQCSSKQHKVRRGNER